MEETHWYTLSMYSSVTALVSVSVSVRVSVRVNVRGRVVFWVRVRVRVG